MPAAVPWSRDELLIALDLYINHRETRSNPRHPALVEASERMRALPLHLDRRDPQTYRSAGSVYARLQNYKAVDPDYPGKGLIAGASDEVRALFEHYADRPAELAAVVSAIRTQGTALAAHGVPVEPNDDEGFFEGAVLMTTHRRSERRGSQKKKDAVIAETGTLACEACGFDFSDRYGKIGEGVAECHHLRPLTEGPRTTKLEDLAIVCSNCHRIIHKQSPPLTLDDVRALVQAARN